jgi:hypothetical protein
MVEGNTMYTASAHDVERGCDVARSEFTRLPTLRLTLAQAQRLWHLDSAACQRVLQRLVDGGYLTIAEDGRYSRPDCRDVLPDWDWTAFDIRPSRPGVDRRACRSFVRRLAPESSATMEGDGEARRPNRITGRCHQGGTS